MKHEELNKSQRQYDRLTLAEKVRRLEILANYYVGLHSRDGKFVVDATKYWSQYEELAKQTRAIEAGAATMEEVMR